eukprot:scaffold28851_cov56-Attheya_sp.AAC.1
MSSRDDSFSENIQGVDLDDPGIWKAKGVTMDSGQRAPSTQMPVWSHYQSKNNKEGHNQQESNDHIDDKDNMQLDNTEESGMDGVLNILIDALSEMAGLRIPVSLNDPSITDHDNTIPAKNGKAKEMREQKETERVVFDQELLDCN